ncbi:DUF5961 family protein [uncultured Brevundimonas sp.]|uniref:DUF5961 family protein n=1 Tax=uncultured Brevundimonas sp. TaxID=213418 RepID=UPI00262B22D0|nr:DUF5961 family protein [uncultured Brevundimonas sp.]
MAATEASELNRYRVTATGHPTRLVEEPTVEAAAVSYIEDFVTSPPVPELKLWVTDIEDGNQHCFVLDTDSGDLEACG